MKDYRKYDLRDLTESIFYMREFTLKALRKNSPKRKAAEAEYEELWRLRDALEDEIFGKEVSDLPPKQEE
jgi:hypothetical protein